MPFEIFENSNRFLERVETLSPRLRRLGIGGTPHRVIHRENKLTVKLYAAGERGRPPVVLIPSMINRHYILDLLPGKSLVEALIATGHPVALIDWGVPGDEDRDLPFERYADDYLRRAVSAVNEACEAESAVLVGYCLGGTMAALYAALRPETVAGLIVLTAPFDFHNTGLLSAWCRTETSDVDSLVSAFGNVPWLLMQSTFHCLRPTMPALRLLGFHKRLWDDEFVDSFAALETWANDNVSFPGRCYAEFIRELYQKNGLMAGTLKLSGERVDFSRIRVPVLNVAASEDHIVPVESTTPLRALIGGNDYSEIIASGGHIGAIVSRKAAAGLWLQIGKWLGERFPVVENRTARRGRTSTVLN